VQTGNGTITDAEAADGGVPTERVDIAIIGAGFAGLGMAIRLRQVGLEDFVVLERADDLGGTWRDNQYPGCAVDVQSHLYSYSFAPNPDWTHVYSPQPEIWAYIRRTAEAHGVLPHVRLGHEVTEATWDDDAQRWLVTTAAGRVEARFLVSGMGPLSNPIPPRIPGLDTFAGPCFHSARWEHEHDLRGKRIGVIGTGSSAAQFVPEVQKVAGHLTVFQRSPGWTIPRMNRRITRAEHTLYRRFPVLQRLARGRQFLYRESLAFGWLKDGRSNWLGALLKLRLRAQVKDPALRAKLTPDYHPGCKRMIVSDDFAPALTRPNVDLVTDAVTSITPGGVVTADGTEHPLDVLILATGFEIMPVADPLRGRDGVTLTEHWGAHRSAYLGTAVAGYPNYFMLGGPNTATGHTSALLYVEAHIEYVIQAVRAVLARGGGSAEVRADVDAAYRQEMADRLKQTVWVSGGCTSWYLDATGGSSALWPGYTFEFRRRLRTFDPGDYVMRSAGDREAAAAA
jgi:cation diffusion facilitator CzcD-associated flavoprotein CzcO